MLLELGEYEEAQRKARAAYFIDKKSPYTNFAYGVVLLKIGKNNDAIEKFESTLKLDSSYSLAHLGIIEAYYNLGRFSEVFDYYDSILNLASCIPEYEILQNKILENILNDSNFSQEIVNCALEYCNKFLQLYNNDRVFAIRDEFVKRINNEARQ